MTDLAVAVAAEIEDLHRFFEGWLSGTLGKDDATFSRFSSALAPDFHLTGPDGLTLGRPELLIEFHGQHGVIAMQIEIRHVRVLWTEDDLVLASYEEWQVRPDQLKGRTSTALLRWSDAAGGGLSWSWLHVHETWLPEGS